MPLNKKKTQTKDFLKEKKSHVNKNVIISQNFNSSVLEFILQKKWSKKNLI